LQVSELEKRTVTHDRLAPFQPVGDGFVEAPTQPDLLNGNVLSEWEERPTMLKYASKLFLEIFLSVLATVIGSYLAHQCIAGRLAAGGPVSLALATLDPMKVDANPASREAVKADVTVFEGPSDVVNLLGPAAPIGSRIVDKTNDEKAAPPVDKLAEPPSVPARLHRSVPRNKRFSRTNTIATPETASLTVAPPVLGRATTERFLGTNANSHPDVSSPPQEIGRDNGVTPPLDPGMTDSHLAGRVLNPIIRTALLILEPSSLVGHAHEPQWRTPPGESHSKTNGDSHPVIEGRGAPGRSRYLH
jgi:hypothetical protein